ncbi:MAG: hypothetical protein ACHQ51_09760 [Elusimicrobiota bacterium]
MSPLLLAAALAAVPARAQNRGAGAGDKTYGILILAYDVDVKWRQELGSLRGQLKGHAVESVDSAGDAISVQRALDRLTAQHVAKVVAIPLETVGESTRLDLTRYMFGVRADPVIDTPGSQTGDLADKKPKALHATRKSALVLPKDQDRGLNTTMGGSATTIKQLNSPVPLVLAPTLDKSPLLVAILADRAKALTATPARETLVLVGVAPRSDGALKAWKTAAQAIADAVGAKAGYRKAVAVGVRDGVRSDQQDKDRSELQTTFRKLIREGRVAVVPLSPEAERSGQLLKKTLGGFYAYRWNGQGIQGDRRLLDWIKTSAEAAAALPDGRQFNDGARGAPGGRR